MVKKWTKHQKEKMKPQTKKMKPSKKTANEDKPGNDQVIDCKEKKKTHKKALKKTNLEMMN